MTAAELQRENDDAEDAEIARHAFAETCQHEEEKVRENFEEPRTTSQWAIRSRKKQKSDLFSKPLLRVKGEKTKG